MRHLELFPFRYRDHLTGKWVRARYLAERHVIAARHAEWEIIGPPEIRDVDPDARYFTPWKVMPHAELMRLEEPVPELQPHLADPPAIDESEALLATLFLRRYVTYCAKRRRFAQMQGAARLHKEITQRCLGRVEPRDRIETGKLAGKTLADKDLLFRNSNIII